MFCKLIVCANHWVKESDWKDLALVKLCVGALGAILGLTALRVRLRPGGSHLLPRGGGLGLRRGSRVTAAKTAAGRTNAPGGGFLCGKPTFIPKGCAYSARATCPAPP